MDRYLEGAKGEFEGTARQKSNARRLSPLTVSGALGPDGHEIMTPEGVRNNAKTIYQLPMRAQGYKGRAK